MTKRTLIAFLVLAVFQVNQAAMANVTINIIFGEGFDGPNAVQQQRVVLAAADYWEAVILTDFTIDIVVNQVDLSPIGSGVLGRMHSNTETPQPNPGTMTRLPATAVIELALNRIGDFYFDSTPYDNEEFFLDERGIGFAKPGSDAEPFFDALTVWIHEIGHVMGFSGGSGTYSDGNPFFAYTDFSNNFIGGFEYRFDWLTVGMEGNDGDSVTMFNVFHISDTGPNGWVASLNPFVATGSRRLLTPIDVDIVGDAFHLEIDDLAIPILGDVNCDGSVDLLDISPFIDAVNGNEYIGKADINGDGSINLLDVQPFVALLL